MFSFIRNPADLSAALVLGTTTESLYMDFKRTINNWRIPSGTQNRAGLIQEAQKELARDVAQFANSDGGCLLIGVQEARDPMRQLNVAQSIVNVLNPVDMKAWIEQAIRNYCVPATFSHEVVQISTGTDTVIVVNVAPSRHLVSLWDSSNHTAEFLRRTSHGKDWMNPDKAERHLMNSSRAARLAVSESRQLAATNQVIISGGLRLQSMGQRDTFPWQPHSPVTIGNLGSNWFELSIPISATNVLPLNVPYGIVSEAWIDAVGRLNLFMSMIPVIGSNNEVALVPR